MTNRKEKLEQFKAMYEEFHKEVYGYFDGTEDLMEWADKEIKCQENKEEHKCETFKTVGDTTKYNGCIECGKPEEIGRYEGEPKEEPKFTHHKEEPIESSVCTCKNPEAYVYGKGSTHFYCCNMCDKQIASEEPKKPTCRSCGATGSHVCPGMTFAKPKEDTELLDIIEQIGYSSVNDMGLVEDALRVINKKINK